MGTNQQLNEVGAKICEKHDCGISKFQITNTNLTKYAIIKNCIYITEYFTVHMYSLLMFVGAVASKAIMQQTKTNSMGGGNRVWRKCLMALVQSTVILISHLVTPGKTVIS